MTRTEMLYVVCEYDILCMSSSEIITASENLPAFSAFA